MTGRSTRRDWLKAAGLTAASPLLGLMKRLGAQENGRSAGPATPGLRSLAADAGLRIGAAFGNDSFRSDPRYGNVLAREFNLLVAENSMKLDVVQRTRGEFDFSQAEEMMAFAARQAMSVRAVPLVWHDALPDWARDKVFPKAEAMDILRGHIFTVMRRFRGRVSAWDVLNEALSEKGPGLREEGPWFRSIGPGYVEQVYHWAHEADPQAVLFYNDYGIEGLSKKAGRCYKWIGDLLARGVPIHGLGLQFHVRTDEFPSPADVGRNIRRFNDLGLIVHIAELDVWVPQNAGPEELRKQAEIYGGVFETALAEKCPAVVLWGFTDRYSWVPGISNGTYGRALLFDGDFRPKAAYQAVAAALARGRRTAPLLSGRP